MAALLSATAFVSGCAARTSAHTKAYKPPHDRDVQVAIVRSATEAEPVISIAVHAADYPLPGTTVTLQRTDSRDVTTLVTDSNGVATANGFGEGTYRVVVGVAGFGTPKILDLELHRGDVARAQVTLAPIATLGEVITVPGVQAPPPDGLR